MDRSHSNPALKNSLLMVTLLFSLTMIALIGCDSSDSDNGSSTPVTGAKLLALGDSVMEWNREQGASIPDVIGQEIGLTVQNNAESGGLILFGSNTLNIPSQYVSGDWEWVVFDGGANDLNDECGCDDCGMLLDQLIAADGRSGAIVDLALQARNDGAKVMFMGYYELPSDAEFGFDRCNQWLNEHTTRAKAMADAFDGVEFVSAADVMRASNASAYDDDRVHPSVSGSRLVGEYVAAAMQATQ